MQDGYQLPNTCNGHVCVLFFKGSLMKDNKMLMILSHTRCFGQVLSLIVNVCVCWLSSNGDNLITFTLTSK